jgi:hypothetical protein
MADGDVHRIKLRARRSKNCAHFWMVAVSISAAVQWYTEREMSLLSKSTRRSPRWTGSVAPAASPGSM